ncbi:MAG: sodium:proton antiporter [Ignavibacteria bacterium]|nr:sodium:proton antiporter [Ignavibacteria bacterium]MBT8382108.1 sodium:proton antiporter [Ignavibacteria bacterium]MBT8392020.1 sodium:proton antiporter [Ignavibacteria bacterium]NNJ51813.1 citrate transporter [Ignavibacteriaceae bacterium]NNL21882.1 citrate transporter [Ignavibacteriaceae bacterium]
MNKFAITIIVLFSILLISSSLIAENKTVSDTLNTAAVLEKETTEQHDLPSPYMVLPFIILLTMIATGPLFYHHFWETNYPKIAIALGAVTVTYYLVFLQDTHSLIHTAAEYLSFIALLASLFVAAGGIFINIDKKSTPWLNAGILLFGACIANIIGTTGASMLLIRPFIKVNKHRIKPYHIVFFIFLVSNIGGALTPIGDPPLFLGFLRGVEFFWVIQHVWYIWLPTMAVVLVIFLIIDFRNLSESEEEVNYTGKFEFKGGKSVIYLAIIVISVFIDPAVMSWVPSLAPLPIGIREIIMFSVVFLAYQTADDEILKSNEFDFEPIKEVAYLFVGIFATMIPALQLISYEANVLGDRLTPGMFYFATGFLSAFLDNAPTYLNFLSAEMGKFGLNVNDFLEVIKFSELYPIYLSAISVAAVFFGAMTYIGNGPNFMVKSISERAGIKMPSFFGYLIKYALPILLPIYIIIWAIFYYNQV